MFPPLGVHLTLYEPQNPFHASKWLNVQIPDYLFFCSILITYNIYNNALQHFLNTSQSSFWQY